MTLEEQQDQRKRDMAKLTEGRIMDEEMVRQSAISQHTADCNINSFTHTIEWFG